MPPRGRKKGQKEPRASQTANDPAAPSLISAVAGFYVTCFPESVPRVSGQLRPRRRRGAANISSKSIRWHWFSSARCL
eukprot:4456656-Pyramimonas_sp.AAC.1